MHSSPQQIFTESLRVWLTWIQEQTRQTRSLPSRAYTVLIADKQCTSQQDNLRM